MKNIIRFFKNLFKRKVVLYTAVDLKVISIENESNSLSEALGISDERRDELINKTTSSYRSFQKNSMALEELSKEAKHPNELAFMAFSMGTIHAQPGGLRILSSLLGGMMTLLMVLSFTFTPAKAQYSRDTIYSFSIDKVKTCEFDFQGEVEGCQENWTEAVFEMNYQQTWISFRQYGVFSKFHITEYENKPETPRIFVFNSVREGDGKTFVWNIDFDTRTIFKCQFDRYDNIERDMSRLYYIDRIKKYL